MSGPRENLERVSELSDEERQIERLLAELAPREGRMNRDRTMFRAGQAAGVSRATGSRDGRWVWPAITVCSTAAGLLAGILIAGSSRPAAQVVRQAAEKTSDDSPSVQQSILAQNPQADSATVAADSPSLLELRIAMATRAGDELSLAQSDLPASRGRAAAVDAPAAGSFAPITYGAALGQLRADEKDL